MMNNPSKLINDKNKMNINMSYIAYTWKQIIDFDTVSVISNDTQKVWEGAIHFILF